MTHFLASDEKPDGYKLEDILSVIRADIIKRAEKILDDSKPEARTVLKNNIRILGLLSECIDIAEDSTAMLNRSFGPNKGSKPRIGRA